MNYSLWSAGLIASIISIFFVFQKDYGWSNWIKGNAIIWTVIFCIYFIGFIYSKAKNKSMQNNARNE